MGRRMSDSVTEPRGRSAPGSTRPSRSRRCSSMKVSRRLPAEKPKLRLIQYGGVKMAASKWRLLTGQQQQAMALHLLQTVVEGAVGVAALVQRVAGLHDDVLLAVDEALQLLQKTGSVGWRCFNITTKLHCKDQRTSIFCLTDFSGETGSSFRGLRSSSRTITCFGVACCWRGVVLICLQQSQGKARASSQSNSLLLDAVLVQAVGALGVGLALRVGVRGVAGGRGGRVGHAHELHHARAGRAQVHGGALAHRLLSGRRNIEPIQGSGMERQQLDPPW